MALDFIQIRWQQIRMTEASQLIETENIALKKEVKELQEKLAAASNIAPVVVKEDNEGSKKIVSAECANMRNTMMRLQSDLVKLKLSSVQEISGLMSQKQMLSKAFNQYVSMYNLRDAQYEAMEYSRDELQQRLDVLKQELINGRQNQSEEFNQLKVKFKSARSDLIDAQGEINRLNELNKSLENRCADLTTAKAETDAHYNVLNAEFLGMQAVVERVRAEAEAALESSHSLKAAMQESYEKIVGELGYENEYLRKTCAEQEEQIAKLTNALVGNKSHFARYVEVKTENLTLQSKLEAAKKNSSRRFVSADTTTGSTTAAPTTSIGSVSSAKASAHFDPTGLPAHQRRNKGVFQSAGIATLSGNVAGGGGGGNGASAPTSTWSSSSLPYTSSSIKQCSPRIDVPIEPSVTSTRATKPTAHREVTNSFISSGVQMMFPASASGDDADVDIISPQSSPRYDAPPQRAITKVDSSNSIQSHGSTLTELAIASPPATALKPARSSYAGGVARLSSPRLVSPRTEDSHQRGSAGSAKASNSGGRRQRTNSTEGSIESVSAPSITGGTGVVPGLQGHLRGHALTDSRASPHASPRRIQVVGRLESSSSFTSTLAEPSVMPPPTNAIRPLISITGITPTAVPAPVSSSDGARGGTKKTLRFESATPAAPPVHGIPTNVAKIELSFGEVGKNRERSFEKHII